MTFLLVTIIIMSVGAFIHVKLSSNNSIFYHLKQINSIPFYIFFTLFTTLYIYNLIEFSTISSEIKSKVKSENIIKISFIKCDDLMLENRNSEIFYNRIDILTIDKKDEIDKFVKFFRKVKEREHYAGPRGGVHNDVIPKKTIITHMILLIELKNKEILSFLIEKSNKEYRINYQKINVIVKNDNLIRIEKNKGITSPEILTSDGIIEFFREFGLWKYINQYTE